ncbi:protein fam214a-like [Plakobranchus ocellatus]|uniref:Protein fam214a-like n=1 Tax=Plakobranchus ocellatus TaxID=259542 RepID=A0AAV4BT89_9GAST|nr:protein fam214a-like [Plakobranchus ocellatus]
MEEAALGHSTHADDTTCTPRAPAQLLRDLVLLVREARTPDLSVKGRAEGPHCPLLGAGIRGRSAHKCLADKAECVEASEYCRQAARLWLMGVPVCIDVLLLSTCDLHGDRCREVAALDREELEAPALQSGTGRKGGLSKEVVDESRWPLRRGAGKSLAAAAAVAAAGDSSERRSAKSVHSEDGWRSSKAGGEEGLLLERWTIEARKRGQEEGMPPNMLIQAVRSHLHFSQISSWLYSTAGKLPGVLVYRVNAPMEELCPDLHSLSDRHQFPVCSTGPCSRLLVTVASLPRLPAIPAALSPCQRRTSAESGDRSFSHQKEFLESPARSFNWRQSEHSMAKCVKSPTGKVEFSQGVHSNPPHPQELSRDLGKVYETTNRKKSQREDVLSSGFLQARRSSGPDSCLPISAPEQAKDKLHSAQCADRTPEDESSVAVYGYQPEAEVSDDGASLASSFGSHSTLSSFDESQWELKDLGPDTWSDIPSQTWDRQASQLSAPTEKCLKDSVIVSNESLKTSSNVPCERTSHHSFKNRSCEDHYAVQRNGEDLSNCRTLEQSANGDEASKNGEGMKDFGKIKPGTKREIINNSLSQEKAVELSDQWSPSKFKEGQSEGLNEARKLGARAKKKDGEKDMRIEQRKDGQTSQQPGEDKPGFGEQESQEFDRQNVSRNKKRLRKQRQQLRKQKQKQQQEQQRQQRELREQKTKECLRQPNALSAISSQFLSRHFPQALAAQRDLAGQKEIATLPAFDIASKTKTEAQSSCGKTLTKKGSNRKQEWFLGPEPTLSQQEASEEEFIRRLSDRLSVVQSPSQAWKCEYAQELRDEMVSKEEAAMRRSRERNEMERVVREELIREARQMSWRKGEGQRTSEMGFQLFNKASEKKREGSDVKLDGLSCYRDISKVAVVEKKEEEQLVGMRMGSSGVKSLRDIALSSNQKDEERSQRWPKPFKNPGVLSEKNRVQMLKSITSDAIAKFHQLSIDVDNPSNNGTPSNSTGLSSFGGHSLGQESSSSSSDTTPVASPRPSSAQGDSEPDTDRPEVKVKPGQRSLVKIVGEKLTRKAFTSQNGESPWAAPVISGERETLATKDKPVDDLPEQWSVADCNGSLGQSLRHLTAESTIRKLAPSKDIGSAQLEKMAVIKCTNTKFSSYSMGKETANLGRNIPAKTCNTASSSLSPSNPVENLPASQTNSRKIFQENRLPLMSYDALSASFKRIGGDWLALHHDSGNYHDAKCPHHAGAQPGRDRDCKVQRPHQPLLHSPKVLFSNDLPILGFNKDGSEESVDRIILPTEKEASLAALGWDISSTQQDHESVSKNSRKCDHHAVTASSDGVAATARHHARRQLDYQQPPEEVPTQKELAQSSDVNASSHSVCPVVLRKRATSSAIDIVQMQAAKPLLPNATETANKNSALNQKEKELKHQSPNSDKSYPPHQHASKLSPQLASPSPSSSSSSSSSSVRLGANTASKLQPHPASSSSLLASLLSQSQQDVATDACKSISSSSSTPSSSVSPDQLPLSSSISALTSHTTSAMPEPCSSTSQMDISYITDRSVNVNSSSSHTEGSKPLSLSTPDTQNSIQQPLPPGAQTDSAVVSPGDGSSVQISGRPHTHSYALLLGEVIPFTECQNGRDILSSSIQKLQQKDESCQEDASDSAQKFLSVANGLRSVASDVDNTLHRSTRTSSVDSSLGDCQLSPQKESLQGKCQSTNSPAESVSCQLVENEEPALTTSQSKNDIKVGVDNNRNKNEDKGYKDADDDVVFYLSETTEDSSESARSQGTPSQSDSPGVTSATTSSIQGASSHLSRSRSTQSSTSLSQYAAEQLSISSAMSDLDKWFDNTSSGNLQRSWERSRPQSVSSSSSSISFVNDDAQKKREHSKENPFHLPGSLSSDMNNVAVCMGESPGWSSIPPHRTVSTPSRLDTSADGLPGAGEASSTGHLSNGYPNMQQAAGLRRLAMRSSSMVFNNRTGLPTQSSPAPLKRKPGGSFDYDAALVGARAIQSALSCSGLVSDGNSSSSKDLGQARALSTSAPASSNCLLGNFEESLLNGRISPAGVVEGFNCELGASGSFCPSHLRIPVTAFFFSSLSDDNAPSPYLGHINLETVGKRGYHIPKQGTVQVICQQPVWKNLPPHRHPPHLRPPQTRDRLNSRAVPPQIIHRRPAQPQILT